MSTLAHRETKRITRIPVTGKMMMADGLSWAHTPQNTHPFLRRLSRAVLRAAQGSLRLCLRSYPSLLGVQVSRIASSQ